MPISKEIFATLKVKKSDVLGFICPECEVKVIVTHSNLKKRATIKCWKCKTEWKLHMGGLPPYPGWAHNRSLYGTVQIPIQVLIVE